MSENQGDTQLTQPIRQRFKFQSLPPEQREQRAALGYEKNTADWFSHDMTLEGYENLLGFNRKDLEGKMILDLGTSPGDQLARDIKEAGINATVVGISPDLQDESLRKHPRLPEGYERKGVAGIAQALPFVDESFDMILGSYSVTWAASSNSPQVKAWVSEIGRVLKTGGEARVGPHYGDGDGRNWSSMGKDFENVIEWAKAAGLDTEIGEHSLNFRKLEDAKQAPK